MACLTPPLIYYIYYSATHCPCVFVYVYLYLYLCLYSISIHSKLNHPDPCFRVRVLVLPSRFLRFRFKFRELRFFNLEVGKKGVFSTSSLFFPYERLEICGTYKNLNLENDGWPATFS
ncbi:hypothetical protein F0562_024347 [Nyssa sinensis]|uniref:Uncharacterized protein n=1 Tax=Nyssa sinensis TaxID=561372 RepID=A0A5J5BDJ8_9ASTE|nr:hypothetical protein F0562_024347 [Nyssa sinensis]